MVKEALWVDGWMEWMDGWIVIIGHRSSQSTFGANKVFSKKLKWESPYFSNCDLHEALDILSLLVHSETLSWEWDGFHFRVQILRTKIYLMIALTFFHGPPT